MSSEPKAADAVEDVLALIDDYWCLAYAEGKEGRTHDTEQGDAQRCLSQIKQALSALRAELMTTQDELTDCQAEYKRRGILIANLRAEASRLCAMRDAAAMERDTLRAEAEALRRDAQRYRWLKQRDIAIGHLGHGEYELYAWADMAAEYKHDSVIDAAMENPA